MIIIIGNINIPIDNNISIIIQTMVFLLMSYIAELIGATPFHNPLIDSP